MMLIPTRIYFPHEEYQRDVEQTISVNEKRREREREKRNIGDNKLHVEANRFCISFYN